jgi:two-component system chemotaxis response regulator CheY
MSLATVPHSSELTPTRCLRILYAEDVKELRELISECLGRDGHHVETAADGRIALTRITAGQMDFDVIITDHHMPNMNGLELVRRLRALAFPGKILVFSSDATGDTGEAYRALEVQHIIPKPIFPLTLRNIIAAL